MSNSEQGNGPAWLADTVSQSNSDDKSHEGQQTMAAWTAGSIVDRLGGPVLPSPAAVLHPTPRERTSCTDFSADLLEQLNRQKDGAVRGEGEGGRGKGGVLPRRNQDIAPGGHPSGSAKHSP